MNANEAGTILIVDDSPRNLGVLSDMLSGAGFEVAAAVHGARALDLAREVLPDLVLLDVRMDGLDGFEVCRRLKAEAATSEIPVIFLTASSDQADKVKGLELGAVDFIHKPVQQEELLARVRVHTKLRHVMKSLAQQVAERIEAESALQKLTHELERRVRSRTLELEKTLERLEQSQAQMATVIRAAQAVAGEVILDAVLDRLMRITLEHAAAERCVLVLRRDAGLFLEAQIARGDAEVALGLALPLGAAQDLAAKIVEQVAATQASAFLWTARRDARFADDPYLAQHPSKAVLCLPMMYQGDVVGVLYIESEAHAEPPPLAQSEILGLLASQAAVAVKNALLYAHLDEMAGALRTSNERLEAEVAARTEELRRTNDRLTLELIERERAEQERAALQEEVIRAQDIRLAELATPLIPITDRIMVMPLIGTIDAGRAQQGLEAALHGVQRNRAQVVIIDVTGVKLIDATVANTLMSTAAALRLLGAQAVITGIRPDLAQTLVALGIDLSAVVTMGTLQSGIGYALGKASDGAAALGGFNHRAGPRGLAGGKRDGA